MPDVWQIYACEPCSSAVARGGTPRGHDCPSCGRPMKWLTEHQAEVAS